MHFLTSLIRKLNYSHRNPYYHYYYQRQQQQQQQYQQHHKLIIGAPNNNNYYCDNEKENLYIVIKKFLLGKLFIYLIHNYTYI